MGTDLDFGARVWAFIQSDEAKSKDLRVALEGYFTGAWTISEVCDRMARLRSEAAEALIPNDLKELKQG